MSDENKKPDTNGGEPMDEPTTETVDFQDIFEGIFRKALLDSGSITAEEYAVIANVASIVRPKLRIRRKGGLVAMIEATEDGKVRFVNELRGTDQIVLTPQECQRVGAFLRVAAPAGYLKPPDEYFPEFFIGALTSIQKKAAEASQ